jgi:hypothetical protein
MRKPISTAIALLVVIAAAAPVAAEEVIIGVEQGAEFDATVDGYPMLAAFDGVPDFPAGYNTLSIGLQLGVTEERGIGEFPLRALPAGMVRTATLVFNIDDVIGTFGPGTSFRGTASQRILVHLYAGDGEVTIDDHLAIERPAHLVEPQGRITDQTLAQSGPLTYDVDVTDEAREIIAAAPVAIGVVFRTTDSPSATSLDHLGDAGAGPPGVNGSFLPYLRLDIEPVADVTPTPTATATAIAATATATSGAATPTSTPIATGPTGCSGDCNGDGAVAINELVRGVSMGLGATGDCASLDDNRDGSISIDELVRAVSAALGGC